MEPDVVSRISERQMRLWNVLHSTEHAIRTPEKAGKFRYRFVTLSRNDGSLGDEIAMELANRLEWHLFDKEIVNCIAENHHVREDIVRQLDERSQGMVQEAIMRLLRGPGIAPFGSDEYHESLLKILTTLATHGGAILVGRGANFALRRLEHGLHVRITGSLDARVRRASETWQISEGKARARLMASDAERRNFIHHYYRSNADDLQCYDLVFNTDNLSVDQAVNSIMSAMLPEILIREPRVF
jgi:hypothetical protein